LPAASPSPPDFQLTTNPVDGSRVEGALQSAYEGLSPRPGPWESIREAGARVMARLMDLAGALLEAGSGAGRIIAWAALVGLASALIWGAVWLLRRVGLVKETSALRQGERRERVDWRAAAEAALSRGDLVAATRALYRQLLDTLMAKGWLTDRPGLTAGDCRRAARRIPGLYGDIETATAAFESVAYGKHLASERDIEVLRKAESLVAAAPGPESPAGLP